VSGSETAAAGAARGGVVRQGGRDKAYRPLAPAVRREALIAALAAWSRDDWFEAHELLEPAWMGTDDPAERDLYQGLIKLAAAYVHQARGNALGMAKNLAGAQARLRNAAAAAGSDSVVAGIAVAPILASLATRVAGPGRPADLAVRPPALPVQPAAEAA
jgi:hypothetical protein